MNDISQVNRHTVAEIDGCPTAGTAIDWNQDIKFPLWFRKRTYIKTVSQFYHGERLTQMMCRRLIDDLSAGEAKEFVRSQLVDETRHEKIFKTYIERMGDIAPIEPALDAALRGSLEWRGSDLGSPLGLIISFHVVFEGGAVKLLERLSHCFPCPLFRDINRQIRADEARHIAFGVNFVRQNIGRLSAKERIAIYAHVGKIWRQCAETAAGRYTLPVAMVTQLGGNWVQENWQRQERVLRKIDLVTPEEAAMASP